MPAAGSWTGVEAKGDAGVVAWLGSRGQRWRSGLVRVMRCSENGDSLQGTQLRYAEIGAHPASAVDAGRPVENTFVESFNGRLREECLNINWFMSVRHAREVIENWRQDYNEVRPHS